MPILNKVVIIIGCVAFAACGPTETTRSTLTSAEEGSANGGSVSIADIDEATNGGQDEPAIRRSQCFNIVNGRETDDFPSVVMIMRDVGNNGIARCTATFVSDTTAITAAHCVGSSRNGGVYALIEDCRTGKAEVVEAERVFTTQYRAGDYSSNSDNLELYQQDLAVVTFPDNTAPATSRIGSGPPEDGDNLEMVGFGIEYTPDDPRAAQAMNLEEATKRRGENQYLEPNPVGAPMIPGMINLFYDRERGDRSSAGSYSTTAQGDSGGPLFLNNRLVGVVSSGTLINADDGSTWDWALFTDLFSSDSQDLLEEAAESGAEIPGF